MISVMKTVLRWNKETVAAQNLNTENWERHTILRRDNKDTLDQLFDEVDGLVM